MVVHTCLKCNKEFNRKSMYIAHINKKFDCSPIKKDSVLIPSNLILIPNQSVLIPKNSEINNTINKLCCKFCNKIFYSKSNLTKHLNNNNCKVKKLREEEEEKDKENIFKLLLAKDEQIKKIEEENKKKDEEIKKNNEENKKNMNKLEESNKKLENYVKKLTDMNIDLNNKVGKLLEKMSVNNITNNNITTNNNIINISPNKLVNFGEEDVKEIEFKLFNKCFGKFGKHIFEEASKNIWFNDSKNKNFYISDLSRSKAMVYKNGQFHITPLFTVLTTLNQQLYKYFKHNIEEIKKTGDKKLMEKVEKEIITSYKKFFNAYDKDIDKFIPDSEQLEEFSKVVNDHLSKFFNSVKKDIISNYEQIKNDVLNDNILKQIEYEAPVKKRGRPKKVNNVEEIKVTTIPKSISVKNEIKNMLKDIKEEIKDIKTDKKTNNKTKKEKKGPGMVINRKGKITEIYDSDSD